jgi:hypothetical protein
MQCALAKLDKVGFLVWLKVMAFWLMAFWFSLKVSLAMGF